MNLDHVTIRTRDLQATRSFFLSVFDLEEGERPLAIQRIPGHWLYAQGHPLVHIIGSQGSGFDRGAEAIDHVGFRMTGYAAFRNKLNQLDTSRMQPIAPIASTDPAKSEKSE